MIGGASHLEGFDPKPALNRYAGKTIDETPHADVLESPFLDNQRDLFDGFPRTYIQAYILDGLMQADRPMFEGEPLAPNRATIRDTCYHHRSIFRPTGVCQ